MRGERDRRTGDDRVNKQDRDELKASYLDGTDESQAMVRLFAYVDELETKLADLSQEDLFEDATKQEVFVQTDYDPETGEYTTKTNLKRSPTAHKKKRDA